MMHEHVYRVSNKYNDRCLSLSQLTFKNLFRWSLISSCCFSFSAVAVINDGNNNPFNARQIQRLIYTKCHGIVSSCYPSENYTKRDSNGGIWAYEGQLVNPITGQKICDVEGIELTRHVANFQKIDTKDILDCGTNNNLKLLDDLKVRSALFPSSIGGANVNSTAPTKKQHEQCDWDYASTILSRKLFCYKDSNNQLLSKFKLRPGGKARKVSPKEAVALYDAATTYISRNDGRELVIQTEFPNGNCVTAQAAATPAPPASAPSNTTIEFTTFAKFTSSLSSSLPPLLFQRSSNGGYPTSARGDRPPRRRWIQFGPDSSKSLTERFGARETYSYSNLDELTVNNDIAESTRRKPLALFFQKVQSGIQEKIKSIRSISTIDNSGTPATIRKKPQQEVATMKYTRYGECPPWYGPHQYCSLELVGRRVHSLQEAPSLATRLASLTMPEFMSFLHTQHDKTSSRSSTSNTTMSIRQPVTNVELFRLNQLRMPEYGNDKDSTIRDKISVKLRHAVQRFQETTNNFFR